jgi:hypothetical protein
VTPSRLTCHATGSFARQSWPRAAIAGSLQRASSGRSSRHQRRFGSALIYGADRSAYLSVSYDEYVPARRAGEKWLFSNSIAAHIESSAVDHRPRREWAVALLTEIGADPPVLWGAGFMNSEFRAKNLHDGPDGVWALGRDVRASLLGFFWANLFGTPYVDLIGRERLSTAPAGIRNELVVGHIGPQYSFDGRAPDRPTTAPDLGQRRLHTRRPFQVFTADGDHFTPFP